MRPVSLRSSGEPDPVIEYSARELATRAAALHFQREYTLQQAADEFRAGHERLRAGGLLSDHRIPCLRELNAYLRATSGFALRPVAGTLTHVHRVARAQRAALNARERD